MPRTRTFSNERIVEIIEDHDEPFVTVNDLLEHLDVQRSGVHNRLKEMCENGEIEKKIVGASAAVYWVPRCEG